MCGICGIFETEGESIIDRRTLKGMADTLTNRGRDDQGFYSSGGAGLAPRRLSIIDLAAGHQPLSTEDSSICIAFNRETSHFQELNRQYISSGHTFRTRSA